MFWYGSKHGGMWVNFRLGDLVEKALSAIGITSERVERWLGEPCGCKERKEKLNQLSQWAMRITTGKTEDAVKHLENIISDPSSPEEKK